MTSRELQLAKLRRALVAATEKSARLSQARAALPPGSSRARVTSANARWGRAAEAREALAREIARLEGLS